MLNFIRLFAHTQEDMESLTSLRNSSHLNWLQFSILSTLSIPKVYFNVRKLFCFLCSYEISLNTNRFIFLVNHYNHWKNIRILNHHAWIEPITLPERTAIRSIISITSELCSKFLVVARFLLCCRTIKMNYYELFVVASWGKVSVVTKNQLNLSFNSKRIENYCNKLSFSSKFVLMNLVVLY